jgi:hypothetical protein
MMIQRKAGEITLNLTDKQHTKLRRYLPDDVARKQYAETKQALCFLN